MTGSGKKLQAVFFDCNGVIIDDEPIHMRLFQEVLGQQGITLTNEEYYETYIGMDDKGAFQHSLKESGRPVTPEIIVEMVAQKAARYQKVIAKEMILFPGAVALVKSLAQENIPLGLVSGALRNEIELILKSAGIRDVFKILVASEDFTHGKPNPEPYVMGFERMGKALNNFSLNPSQCVAIEDTEAGVNSARSAGMRVLAVTTSGAEEKVRAAEHIVTSLEIITPDDIRKLIQ